MSFRSPRATCDALFDAKMRLRSSCQTLRRNTWRRRWRSEIVARNSSHLESHAVSKHVATTLKSGAPGRKNVETTASIGVPRIFPGSAAVAAGQSIRRPPGPACGEAFETVENGSLESSTGGLGAGAYAITATAWAVICSTLRLRPACSRQWGRSQLLSFFFFFFFFFLFFVCFFSPRTVGGRGHKWALCLAQRPRN